jgi:hypothetical protein
MSSNEHNPWDQTIWDPVNAEQAIEDPMHGPSAIHGMLQTPAMPRGDGTYYQPGAFYAHGTAYLDSQDRPVFRIGSLGMASMREVFELQEWLTSYHEGGNEALTELEASRQNERLEKTGFAHCFKTSDVCPGGKLLEDCEMGSAAYDAAQNWAAKQDQEKPGDGTLSNMLAWAGGNCAECSVSCEVAVKTVEGKPEETRVSFYKPEPNIPVIALDLAVTLSPLSAGDSDKIQLARDFYKGVTETGGSLDSNNPVMTIFEHVSAK